MKKLLSALLLTSFLFGQDKLITVSGSTYEGEYLRKTENGVLFHAKGIINPQDIALTQIDRLILSDGTLFIDYGEFTDGTKKVDVSKEEPSKGGSGFGVRKIGGLLIGISGVMLLSIVNRDNPDPIDSSASFEEMLASLEELDDFNGGNKSNASLAYTLLAVGGLLIALDKE